VCFFRSPRGRPPTVVGEQGIAFDFYRCQGLAVYQKIWRIFLQMPRPEHPWQLRRHFFIPTFLAVEDDGVATRLKLTTWSAVIACYHSPRCSPPHHWPPPHFQIESEARMYYIEIWMRPINPRKMHQVGCYVSFCLASPLNGLRCCLIYIDGSVCG